MVLQATSPLVAGGSGPEGASATVPSAPLLPASSVLLVGEAALRAPWAQKFVDNHPMVAVTGPVGAQRRPEHRAQTGGDDAAGRVKSRGVSAAAASVALGDRREHPTSPAWRPPAFSAGSFIDYEQYLRACGGGGLASATDRVHLRRVATSDLRDGTSDSTAAVAKMTDDTAVTRTEAETEASTIREALRSVGATRATSCPVWHCHNAFAIRFDFAPSAEREWSFVFAGDSRPCDSEVRLSLGCSLLVHEATFEDGLEALAAEKRHSTVS